MTGTASAESHTFDEMITEYRKVRRQAFQRAHPSPVLIKVTHQNEEPTTDYETQLAKPNLATRLAIRMNQDQEIDVELVSSFSLVFPIVKRKGGAFADRIGVGRSRATDVAIRLPAISKYHAYFTQSTNTDEVYLTDAGSKNGTLVEGRRLNVGEAAPIKNWTTIAFGDLSFVFLTSDSFIELVGKIAVYGLESALAL
jgi:hypothetical protein